MDARISETGPFYCDDGSHAGMYRLDIHGSVYLTQDELNGWQRGEISFGINYAAVDSIPNDPTTH